MNKIHSVSVQETNPNVHDEFCEQIEVCASHRVEKLSNSHVKRLIGHQETNWKPGLRVASRKWGGGHVCLVYYMCCSTTGSSLCVLLYSNVKQRVSFCSS